jgi:hypothetical protein
VGKWQNEQIIVFYLWNPSPLEGGYDSLTQINRGEKLFSCFKPTTIPPERGERRRGAEKQTDKMD